MTETFGDFLITQSIDRTIDEIESIVDYIDKYKFTEEFISKIEEERVVFNEFIDPLTIALGTTAALGGAKHIYNRFANKSLDPDRVIDEHTKKVIKVLEDFYTALRRMSAVRNRNKHRVLISSIMNSVARTIQYFKNLEVYEGPDDSFDQLRRRSNDEITLGRSGSGRSKDEEDATDSHMDDVLNLSARSSGYGRMARQSGIRDYIRRMNVHDNSPISQHDTINIGRGH